MKVKWIILVIVDILLVYWLEGTFPWKELGVVEHILAVWSTAIILIQVLIVAAWCIVMILKMEFWESLWSLLDRDIFDIIKKREE